MGDNAPDGASPRTSNGSTVSDPGDPARPEPAPSLPRRWTMAGGGGEVVRQTQALIRRADEDDTEAMHSLTMNSPLGGGVISPAYFAARLGPASATSRPADEGRRRPPRRESMEEHATDDDSPPGREWGPRGGAREQAPPQSAPPLGQHSQPGAEAQRRGAHTDDNHSVTTNQSAFSVDLSTIAEEGRASNHRRQHRKADPALAQRVGATVRAPHAGSGVGISGAAAPRPRLADRKTRPPHATPEHATLRPVPSSEAAGGRDSAAADASTGASSPHPAGNGQSGPPPPPPPPRPPPPRRLQRSASAQIPPPPRHPSYPTRRDSPAKGSGGGADAHAARARLARSLTRPQTVADAWQRADAGEGGKGGHSAAAPRSEATGKAQGPSRGHERGRSGEGKDAHAHHHHGHHGHHHRHTRRRGRERHRGARERLRGRQTRGGERDGASTTSTSSGSSGSGSSSDDSSTSTSTSTTSSTRRRRHRRRHEHRRRRGQGGGDGGGESTEGSADVDAEAEAKRQRRARAEKGSAAPPATEVDGGGGADEGAATGGQPTGSPGKKGAGDAAAALEPSTSGERREEGTGEQAASAGDEGPPADSAPRLPRRRRRCPTRVEECDMDRDSIAVVLELTRRREPARTPPPLSPSDEVKARRQLAGSCATDSVWQRGRPLSVSEQRLLLRAGSLAGDAALLATTSEPEAAAADYDSGVPVRREVALAPALGRASSPQADSGAENVPTRFDWDDSPEGITAHAGADTAPAPLRGPRDRPRRARPVSAEPSSPAAGRPPPHWPRPRPRMVARDAREAAAAPTRMHTRPRSAVPRGQRPPQRAGTEGEGSGLVDGARGEGEEVKPSTGGRPRPRRKPPRRQQSAKRAPGRRARPHSAHPVGSGARVAAARGRSALLQRVYGSPRKGV